MKNLKQQGSCNSNEQGKNCINPPVYMGYCGQCFTERQMNGYWDEARTKAQANAERTAKKGRVTR